MNQEHTLEHAFPHGFFIKAYIDHKEGEPHIAVHWRRPNNQPDHQPFKVPLCIAASVFKELQGFAEIAKHDLTAKPNADDK